eukprot:3229029-Pyramimonas_sp.AAC.1
MSCWHSATLRLPRVTRIVLERCICRPAAAPARCQHRIRALKVVKMFAAATPTSSANAVSQDKSLGILASMQR